MQKHRLDILLVSKGIVPTRSQAENYIKLGKVKVAGKIITKPGYLVAGQDIQLLQDVQYVSRAALKLAGIAETPGLDFKDKIVLDVGSSTGGFTDFALKHGAKKVIAVDVGTGQMHPLLRPDPRLELHEKTDIRDFQKPAGKIDLVLIDVSFISLRQILPKIKNLSNPGTVILALCKPQFEASSTQLNKGLVKNDSVRRKVLKEFEDWAKNLFKVIEKKDSSVYGAKGNLERFYLMRIKT